MRQVEDRDAPASPAHGRSWICAVALLSLAVLAYLPATRCAFIWDDDNHLTANPCIIGPLGLQEIWTSAHARICPLVLTTFWIEHRLWGLNPLPYHLVNVLMHAATALVLWRVLRRLKIPGAWLGAALWMLHPVQVESVAWITEMKNTQSGLFFLLAILFFCKSKQTDSAETQKNHSKLYYGLTLLFGAMALASKSSTVVLPLVLGLCAWWMDGRWLWRRNLMQLSPLLLMSLLAGVLSILTQRIEGAGDDQQWALSAAQRLVVAGRALWFYLGKLLWPHPLVMIYPRWELTTMSVLAWLPLIAAVAVSIVLYRNRNRWNGRGRALFFSWSYFVIALLPVLGLLNHGFLQYSFVGDHFQYLASMGPLALAGAGIRAALNHRHRAFKPALCSLLLLMLGALTWRQCAIYQNEEVLWNATLPRNPSCFVAYNNLGIMLQQKGRVDEALAHYEKAGEISPTYAEAHNNLGSALQRVGRMNEAEAHYQKAVQLAPRFTGALINLGLALQQRGRLDEAQTHYQKALEIQPWHPVASSNLGGVLQQKGRLDEAMALYQKALAIRPGYAVGHNNLGSVLQQKGHMDEAMAHFQKALEIDPGLALAHNNLGVALGHKGRMDEALSHFQQAVGIDPAYAEARNNLGFALQQKGRLDEAIAHYEVALKINPGYAEAHKNLGILLQQKERLGEAVDHYQKAVEINPNDASSLNNLAYLLAASDTASLRDGARAVTLAQQASVLSGGGNPVVLGTLAAAHAEAGDFSKAVATIQHAIRLAESQGQSGLAAALREHLKLYQGAQPLRRGK